MSDSAQVLLKEIRTLIARHEPLPPNRCIAVFVMEKRGEVHEDGQEVDIANYWIGTGDQRDYQALLADHLAGAERATDEAGKHKPGRA